MRWTVAALTLVLVASPCAGAGTTMKIAAESKAGADFSRYQTYLLKEGTRARRPELHRSIERSVERELRRRGMSPVDGAADVWVLIYALVDEHSLAQLEDRSYWEFYTGLTSVDAYEVQAGTLVVDVVDAESEEIVWRGLITGAVRESVEVVERRLDKSVTKLFKRYPRR